MRGTKAGIATIAALMLLSSPAEAQRRTALVIGGHGQGGVLFPVSSRMAIRADLAIQHNSSNSSFGSGEVTFLDIGFSTLHDLRQLDDNLVLYLAPRIGTREIFEDDPIGDVDYFDVSLAIGLEGRVAGRLRLFAELGPQLRYQESTVDLGGGESRTTSRSWTFANAIGVTFRF